MGNFLNFGGFDHPYIDRKRGFPLNGMLMSEGTFKSCYIIK